MILCCGEALIDMIPSPTKSGQDGYVPHSGGAVFNTAIALGRLNESAGLLSGLSTDLFGLQLVAALSASNVDTSHIIHSDRPTTLAFVRLSDGQAQYTFYDENSAGRILTVAALPTLDETVTTLFFGGISLACEPCADTYATLAEREAANSVIMLDPNIRPGFIRDQNRYRDRLNRLIGLADIIKVSDQDLDWIYPGPDSTAAKAHRLCAAGSSIVFVTRGKDGADAYCHGQNVVHVPARPIAVADTVGAGDTFNAGILAQLSRIGLLSKASLQNLTHDQLEQVLGFGIRVAGITVSRVGANPPWAAELD